MQAGSLRLARATDALGPTDLCWGKSLSKESRPVGNPRYDCRARLPHAVVTVYRTIPAWLRIRIVMKSVTSLLLAVLLFILEAGRPSFGCTLFSAAANGHVFFGNNEDSPHSYPSMMWFVPASSVAHGRVCFGWFSFAQGGMND